MNSTLHLKSLGAVLFLILSLAAAPAQPVPPRAPANPPTAPAPAPAIDPGTGLPAAPTPPQWIDPNWNNPNLVLTNVEYDGLPISEVARQLRRQFQDYFDILPMPYAFNRDWGTDITVKLQLRQVGAREIFNAMNLVFENEQTPVRWELRASEGRPMVLLRVLPEAAPAAQAQNKPADAHRMVYFVGNLIGDEKSGGMTMEQIIKTITEVWPQEFGAPESVVQFHKDAQLIVVNGDRAQLDFVQQTLKALEHKADLAHPKDSDLKELEELGRVLQKEPYSNILKSIFKEDAK